MLTHAFFVCDLKEETLPDGLREWLAQFCDQDRVFIVFAAKRSTKVSAFASLTEVLNGTEPGWTIDDQGTYELMRGVVRYDIPGASFPFPGSEEERTVLIKIVKRTLREVRKYVFEVYE